jgi:hypothetical protein
VVAVVGAKNSSGTSSSTERAAIAARVATIVRRREGRRICEIYPNQARQAAKVTSRAWRRTNLCVAVNCRRICARRARTTHAGWAILLSSSATRRSHTAQTRRRCATRISQHRLIQRERSGQHSLRKRFGAAHLSCSIRTIAVGENHTSRRKDNTEH